MSAFIASRRNQMDETDRTILRELEEGVPMVEQPFAEIGSRLRIPEEEVITRIRKMKD
ncbi:AsnC family protein, partial [Methanocalculus sp.]|uniref:AsnC family protein n=1 Tax=Methanocalculus sp. TaxID=2004547 RepID=UPI00345388C6